MKIVHVSVGSLPAVFTAHGGAIQRRVGELARAQQRRGHEVVVVSPGERRGSITVDGIPVRLVACRTRGPIGHLEYQLRVVSRLLVRQMRPDIVHFHSEPEAGVLSAWLPATRVLTYDNFYFRRGRRSPLFGLYRRALGTFDVMLPCSEHCADASARYWQISRSSMRVVYNGVNLSQFRNDPERAALERTRLGLGGPVMLYVGRVCHQKGTDTLLRAWEIVRRSHPEAHLVVAGPVGQFGARGRRESTAAWEAAMHSAGVHYLGQVSDERLSGLLTMADVFAMPTAELEMFGMAAVEAQACGTPVVATDHGGLKETVPEGCGVRVPPGDAQALAAGVVTLLENDDLRMTMGRAARLHAQRYGWDRIAADLEVVYAAASRAGEEQ